MALVKYLGNLGYGTRREVTAMLAAGRIRQAGGAVARDDDPVTHETLRVDGAPLDPAPGAVLMLHKPTGYVCSTKDVPPLVYELLPERFPRRTPVMAPVGRLDRDTSGLLLVTDDGALNHRLTSPRSHSTKTYRATLASDLDPSAPALFASGTLVLAGETTPLQMVTVHTHDARTIDLTLTEGRYHQVRRMLAAVGNHVVTLHRTAMGALTLGDLPAGAWRVLTPEEIALLRP